MRCDPTRYSFTDLLTTFKETAKQANDFAETILFTKLPVQLQNELAMAGKHDATVEEIKTFVQRRCRYAQLFSGTSGMQLLNQAFNYQPKQQNTQPASNHNNADKTNTTKAVKRRFHGICRYCNIPGHKRIDGRKYLRDEANGIKTKVNNKKTTTASSNNNQTNRGTTRSWCARSVAK